MDRLTEAQRSWNMSRIRSKNTKPEMFLRSLLHRAGLRYRLHCKKLPETPDLVLAKYEVIIFIHGCFWHMHGCSNSKLPATRTAWWKNKLESNQLRDQKCYSQLLLLGWRVLVLWECSLKRFYEHPEKLVDIVEGWLNSKHGRLSQLSIGNTITKLKLR